MKITVSAELTPQEFRQCLGLPDMEKFWAEMSDADKQQMFMEQMAKANMASFQSMFNLFNRQGK